MAMGLTAAQRARKGQVLKVFGNPTGPPNGLENGHGHGLYEMKMV